MSEAGDLIAHSGRKIKEEEDETVQQPAAKIKRGQSKSQTKSKELPKEEMKSGGNMDLILYTYCTCNKYEIAFYKFKGAANAQNSVTMVSFLIFLNAQVLAGVIG